MFLFSLIMQVLQPRDDYREFLELACILLGGMSTEKIQFRRPGAAHHARWLAKGIYCLKIFMFKKQFSLKKKEIDGLRRICIFIVCFYIKAWYRAPIAITAPNQDLSLIQSLIRFKETDVGISEAAVSKLCGHLWYISEHLVALSLFDPTVSVPEKLKIVHALKTKEGTKNPQKRIIINPANYDSLLGKNLSDFASKNSLFLFKQFDLSYTFLDKAPELFDKDQTYLNCLKIFKSLRVVNDVAERGVALVEEYHSLLTKSEEQTQFLVQLVQQHRTDFSNCNKTKLASLH